MVDFLLSIFTCVVATKFKVIHIEIDDDGSTTAGAEPEQEHR